MALRDKHNDKLGKFPMGGDIKMYSVQENNQNELKMKTEKMNVLENYVKRKKKCKAKKLIMKLEERKLLDIVGTERMKKVKRHIKNKKKQKADDREQKEDIN